MKVFTMLRGLLPLIGGQALEDRLADFNIGMKRRNRDTGLRLRMAILFALPWIPILAWAGTAFYRSTMRKDELLAEREARRRAGDRGPGTGDQGSGAGYQEPDVERGTAPVPDP